MAATTTVPSAGPLSGSRSFLSKLRDGDEIVRLITFLFAGSVVLITVLLIFDTLAGLGTCSAQVWAALFCHSGMGPDLRSSLGALTVHLWNNHHSYGFAGNCGATGDRSGDFSG